MAATERPRRRGAEHPRNGTRASRRRNLRRRRSRVAMQESLAKMHEMRACVCRTLQNGPARGPPSSPTGRKTPLLMPMKGSKGRHSPLGRRLSAVSTYTGPIPVRVREKKLRVIPRLSGPRPEGRGSWRPSMGWPRRSRCFRRKPPLPAAANRSRAPRLPNAGIRRPSAEPEAHRPHADQHRHRQTAPLRLRAGVRATFGVLGSG